MVSETMALKVGHEAWLPALSVAVHVTGDAPSENTPFEEREQLAERIPELSTAEKLHDATAFGVSPLVGVIRSGDNVEKGGQVNVGVVVST